jgi:hypothetical protein
MRRFMVSKTTPQNSRRREKAEVQAEENAARRWSGTRWDWDSEHSAIVRNGFPSRIPDAQASADVVISH